MSNNHHVVFSGEIVEGAKREEVIQKLAVIAKKDPATIAKLFSGKSTVIKRNASLATCEKIQKSFLSAGAICVINSPSPSQADQTEQDLSQQDEDQQESPQPEEKSSLSADAKLP